jgi:hypothetical protein
MSLANDRQNGRLICQCPRPRYQPVVLFAALVLADVYECAHCGKPILEPRLDQREAL